MRLLTSLGGYAAGVVALGMGSAAMAQGLELVGRPQDKMTGFQPAATELARDLQGLDHMILIIIAVITVFVTALLLWVAFRFHEKRNAKPATFTHNSPLEVAWTIVPILILVFIGAFSLPVLFKQQEIPQGDITIKVTGYQWYWGYEYVDDGITTDETAETVAFDSYMIGAPATGGDNRLTPEVSAQLAEAGYTDDEFPVGDRYGCGCAGWQDRRDAGHRGGCYPLVDDPGLRRQARRGSRSPGASVVRGRAGRHLFRPVLGAVRHRACLHADHHQGRVGRSLCPVAGSGQSG